MEFINSGIKNTFFHKQNKITKFYYLKENDTVYYID